MPTPIPLIDLAPWFEAEPGKVRVLCEQINRVCHEVGFFYVVNHGIDSDVSDAYLQMMKAFFELPQPTKRAIDKQNSPQFRGWESLGSELTNNEIDYREQVDIGVDRAVVVDPDPYYFALLGPNQWPPESALPGFRRTVNDYFERLSEVARQLLSLMSRSLGLDPSYIEQAFGRNPSPYLKLIRYPGSADGEQGVGVHKDSGFLTLLLQDHNSGLEAQGNDNIWYPVDPVPGSLVVNTGELLQLVTHNYFIATPHRVVNRNAAERFSSAFFYSPDLGTALDPLPIDARYIELAKNSERHRNEGLMASRTEMASGTQGMGSQLKPAVFGEKYWQRWVRSYPEIARKFYPQHID